MFGALSRLMFFISQRVHLSPSELFVGYNNLNNRVVKIADHAVIERSGVRHVNDVSVPPFGYGVTG